ncbi:hypothetical protein [Sporosarcina sp. HYO08]|nr:hypothetical protein [Sporosarcina sp. HYO08]
MSEKKTFGEQYSNKNIGSLTPTDDGLSEKPYSKSDQAKRPGKNKR